MAPGVKSHTYLVFFPQPAPQNSRWEAAAALDLPRSETAQRRGKCVIVQPACLLKRHQAGTRRASDQASCLACASVAVRKMHALVTWWRLARDHTQLDWRRSAVRQCPEAAGYAGQNRFRSVSPSKFATACTTAASVFGSSQRGCAASLVASPVKVLPDAHLPAFPQPHRTLGAVAYSNKVPAERFAGNLPAMAAREAGEPLSDEQLALL